MQVECRIGLEDEVAPPFLWWLQAQVYLRSFFQRKLSAEVRRCPSEQLQMGENRLKRNAAGNAHLALCERLQPGAAARGSRGDSA